MFVIQNAQKQVMCACMDTLQYYWDSFSGDACPVGMVSYPEARFAARDVAEGRLPHVASDDPKWVKRRLPEDMSTATVVKL